MFFFVLKRSTYSAGQRAIVDKVQHRGVLSSHEQLPELTQRLAAFVAKGRFDDRHARQVALTAHLEGDRARF